MMQSSIILAADWPLSGRLAEAERDALAEHVVRYALGLLDRLDEQTEDECTGSGATVGLRVQSKIGAPVLRQAARCRARMTTLRGASHSTHQPDQDVGAVSAGPRRGQEYRLP